MAIISSFSSSAYAIDRSLLEDRSFAIDATDARVTSEVAVGDFENEDLKFF